MISTAAALALCRFAEDAATSMLWGASAYLWGFVPEGLGSAVAVRLRGWTVAAVTIAVLAIATKLPVEVAGIGDGWSDALDPATVRGVLLETSVGRAWAAQATCALLLAASAIVLGRWGTRTLAGASGLLLATLSLEGHATMHEGWLGIANRADDIIHVLSGGAWLGSLVPVLVILVLSRHGQRQDEVMTALRGFSRVGQYASGQHRRSGQLRAGGPLSV